MIRELEPGETGLAFAAMSALRPHLADAAEFTRRVDAGQRPQGYRLVAVLDADGSAAAVAGFRVMDTLAWGRVLYIDDLSTRPDARRQGHARALLDHLLGEARAAGCAQMHLDSGHGEDRDDAHRMYLNFGMRLSSHHFSRTV